MKILLFKMIFWIFPSVNSFSWRNTLVKSPVTTFPLDIFSKLSAVPFIITLKFGKEKGEEKKSKKNQLFQANGVCFSYEAPFTERFIWKCNFKINNCLQVKHLSLENQTLLVQAVVKEGMKKISPVLLIVAKFLPKLTMRVTVYLLSLSLSLSLSFFLSFWRTCLRGVTKSLVIFVCPLQAAYGWEIFRMSTHRHKYLLTLHTQQDIWWQRGQTHSDSGKNRPLASYHPPHLLHCGSQLKVNRSM